MPDYELVRSRRGRLRFKYDPAAEALATPPGLFSQIQPRYHRPSLVTVSRVTTRDSLGEALPQKPRIRTSAKLAGSRESAFRYLRSVIAAQSANPKSDVANPNRSRNRREEGSEQGSDMPSVDFLRGPSRSIGASSPLPRPDLLEDAARARTDSVTSIASARSGRADSISTSPDEKPLASGNGVSVSISLAEPLLFLQGYDQNDTSTRSTAMLRGSLHLRVQKSAKLKAVTLKFRGTATTKWPEGIPPKKTDFVETDTLMSHTWPFFNAQFPMAEGGSGADVVRLAKSESNGEESPYKSGSPMGSTLNIHTARDAKRLSFQHVQSRSFDKIDARPQPTVAQKGYRLFHPGTYIYNFELPLDSRLPETLNVDLGFVRYELEASVERAGAFRANLLGTKEVTLIRAPSEGSLEQVEPIAISRNWEDQLHYDIVISGKSFPMGSKIPIAFKLTPLAKVQCHRVKVFITENVEYFCSNKRVHRMEPTRKVLLYEKRADGTTNSTFPGSTQRVLSGGGIPYNQREAAARGETVTPLDPANLLGRLEGQANVGPTEMEFSVQLPGCQQLTDRDRLNQLHFDTTYQNIQVHHWIKIVMRLSRPDTEDPEKRRHFEISIDSPFHILSCRANAANTALPAYTSPEHGPNADSNSADCSCPGAPRRRISPSHLPTLNALNSQRTNESTSSSSTNTENTSDLPLRPSLARPPTAHLHDPMLNGPLQRPIHMLRAPSFNPPAFEDEQPPPPLVTPPPQYNDIASPTDGHGLADYFSRFNAAYDEEDSSDEDRVSIRGRVNLPLTPGGHLNRSVDFGDSRSRRNWEDLNTASS